MLYSPTINVFRDVNTLYFFNKWIKIWMYLSFVSRSVLFADRLMFWCISNEIRLISCSSVMVTFSVILRYSSLDNNLFVTNSNNCRSLDFMSKDMTSVLWAFISVMKTKHVVEFRHNCVTNLPNLTYFASLSSIHPLNWHHRDQTFGKINKSHRDFKRKRFRLLFGHFETDQNRLYFHGNQQDNSFYTDIRYNTFRTLESVNIRKW